MSIGPVQLGRPTWRAEDEFAEVFEDQDEEEWQERTIPPTSPVRCGWPSSTRRRSRSEPCAGTAVASRAYKVWPEEAAKSASQSGPIQYSSSSDSEVEQDRRSKFEPVSPSGFATVISFAVAALIPRPEVHLRVSRRRAETAAAEAARPSDPQICIAVEDSSDEETEPSRCSQCSLNLLGFLSILWLLLRPELRTRRLPPRQAAAPPSPLFQEPRSVAVLGCDDEEEGDDATDDSVGDGAGCISAVFVRAALAPPRRLPRRPVKAAAASRTPRGKKLPCRSRVRTPRRVHS